uniref:SRR1 domain-containing protein n=1 Tax=Parastrongyloides trichosuri TaxID=131310 RepID=A0A0N5A4V6_PARTI
MKSSLFKVRKRTIKASGENLIKEFSTNDNIIDENCTSFDILGEEIEKNEKIVLKKSTETVKQFPKDFRISSRLHFTSSSPFQWIKNIEKDGSVDIPDDVNDKYEGFINFLSNKENKKECLSNSLTYFIFPNILGQCSYPRLYCDMKDYQTLDKKFLVNNEMFEILMNQWKQCLDQNISLWNKKKIEYFYICGSLYTILFGPNEKIIMNGTTLNFRKKLKENGIFYDIHPSLTKLCGELSYEDISSSIVCEKKLKIINEENDNEEGGEKLYEPKGFYPISINITCLSQFILLLKNPSFSLVNYGIHSQLPPSIISAYPFHNSTMKFLNISSRIVKLSSGMIEYHVDVYGCDGEGPILPHVASEMMKYFDVYFSSFKEDVSMEISYYGKDSYNGLNMYYEDSKNVNKITANLSTGYFTF